jgi:glycosyltransferase involved in cell wall biosynthesis
MSVTVVIPTLLERRSVRRTVESAIASAAVLGQDAEVLVAVNGISAEASSDVIENLGSPLLRVLRVPRPSAPGARNAALREARNDTVLFTDDDCLLPHSWCSDFHAALRDGRHPVVASPVQVEVGGTVTAFIDHQRLFDAPPDGNGGARYPVTANCGLRRDLLPDFPRFNDIDFNNAAEDVDFGLTLRAAGHRIGWLDNVAPASHHMSESIEEITARFLRYGRAQARLYTRRGHEEARLPGARKWYGRMVYGTDSDFRRFSEMRDDGLRAAFTVYDLALHASFLIGYLWELGEELDVPLVRVDEKGFVEAWREIADQVAAPLPERLVLDYTQLGRGPSAHTPVPTWFPALLRKHAPPVVIAPVDPRYTHHSAHTEEFEDDRRAFFRRVRDSWSGIDGPAADAPAANDLFRAAGVSFREGCHELEIMERESERNQAQKTTFAGGTGTND